MHFIPEVSDSFWWDVANDCHYATFFHSPLWSRIASETDADTADRTLGAELTNGTRLVLPMIEQDRTLTFRRLESTFGGCYGSVIADGPVPDAEFDEFVETICSRVSGELNLLENPLVTDERPSLEDYPQFEKDDYFTQILQLDGGFDDVYANFTKSRKQGVETAREGEVSVRVAEPLDDYRDYFGAYEASLDRWDEVSSQYPWELFRVAHYLSEEYPEHVRLWITEVDGYLASGALIFYFNDHVDYWHGASYEEYFDQNPNDILQTEIIRDAIDRGYRYYDFNPSGGHEGVVQFKSEFGPEKWPLQRLHFESPMFSRAKAVKSKFDQFPGPS